MNKIGHATKAYFRGSYSGISNVKTTCYKTLKRGTQSRKSVLQTRKPLSLFKKLHKDILQHKSVMTTTLFIKHAIIFNICSLIELAVWEFHI